MRASYPVLIVLIATAYCGPAHSWTPVPKTLCELWQAADLVAVIEVQGADKELFKQPLYRSTVLTAIKGTKVGAKIFHSAYMLDRVGGQYLVFLKTTDSSIADLRKQPTPDVSGIYPPNAKIYQVEFHRYGRMPLENVIKFGDCRPERSATFNGFAVRYEVIRVPRFFIGPSTSIESEDVAFMKWIDRDTVIPFLLNAKSSCQQNIDWYGTRGDDWGDECESEHSGSTEPHDADIGESP